MMNSITQKAASFIMDLQFQDLPPKVLHNAKHALADYVAVTISGARSPSAVMIQNHILSRKRSGKSKVFGTMMRVEVADAVLANGTASHALDFDDVSWTTIGHPTVTVAPVLFAYGEPMAISGSDIITAYVAGVEVQHKIAAALMPEVSDNGWHTTSVFGAIGSTAAAAKLLHLNESQTANALGIAASMSGGVRANFGSLTKAIHVGMVCQQGVNAVDWARSGITSSLNVIEGRDGFAQVFSGKKIDSNDVEFQKSYDLEKNGLVFKRYPCCSGSHTAIDCLDGLLQNHSIDLSEIEQIRVGVSVVGPRELVCNNPQNGIEAKFSMQFVLAARLVYGRVTLAEFNDEAVLNPDIQSLMKKIAMFVDSCYNEFGFMNTSPSNIKIVMKNGESLSGSSDLAKGNPDNPLSLGEMREKFTSCTSNHLNQKEAEKAFDAAMHLEEFDDINSYLNLL